MASLADPPKAQSFYESFTDLIFGTLVLFIVLVMAMALKLQEAKAEASDTAAKTTAKVLDQVSKSRFSGAPDQTILHVCHMPIDGGTHMIFVPTKIAAALEFDRTGNNDPVLEICKLALSGSYVSMSAPDVVGMAEGLTEPLVNWEHAVLIHPSAAAIFYVGRALQRTQPGRWQAESLKRALGGRHFSVYERVTINNDSVRGLFNEWAAYYRSFKDGRGWHETTGELEKRLQHTKDQPPRIRLTCKSRDEIQIGKTQLSVSTVRAFLSAIKPGRGFYIEHVSATGKPVGFPAWFHKEVLKPLGFDRRVIREEALQLAMKKQSGE